MIYKAFSLAIICGVVFSFAFAHPRNQKRQATIQHTGKRGLAWASIVSKDIALFNTSSLVSWNYNWSPNKVEPMDQSGLEFTPMIWNGVDIDKLAAKVHSQQAKVVLAFNEPDLAVEANMDPTTAARLWIQYLEPLRASGIKLGSPAVTQGAAWWLKEFFRACNGSCTVDFICTVGYNLFSRTVDIYFRESLYFVSIGTERVLAISTIGFGPSTINFTSLYGSPNTAVHLPHLATSLHSCKPRRPIWTPCPGLRDMLGLELFEILKARWARWGW